MGNGTRASLGKRRRIDRSIAPNDVAARAKFAAVDARGRAFPENRRSARGKFTPARKRNFGRGKCRNGKKPSAELKSSASGSDQCASAAIAAAPAGGLRRM